MNNNNNRDKSSLKISRPQWQTNISQCTKTSALQTTTLCQDFIITYGGDGKKLPGNFRRQISIYHIPTNSWGGVAFSPDSLEPLERAGHSACLYTSNKILVFGGWDGYTIRGEPAVIEIQQTNPFTIKYQRLETIGGEDLCRWAHTANIYENHMYMFGGRTKFDREAGTKKSSDELWSLDLQNFEWQQCSTTGDQPEARDSHTSVLYKEKLFIFGGFSTSGKARLGETYVISLKLMKWEKPAPQGIPYMPRSAAFSEVLGHTLYIFGGSNASAFASNDLLKYSLESNTLERVYALNHQDIQPVRDSRGVVYDNSLIIMGGNTQERYHTFMHRLLLTNSQRELFPKGPQGKAQSNPFPCNFQNLLFSEKYSDIQFLVEDEKISAHRVVIAVRCNYFENMFSSGMQESKSSCLKIEDVKLNIFKAFLEFLYTNNIQFENIVVSELYQLADKYQQKDLIQICDEYYLERLNLSSFKEIRILLKSMAQASSKHKLLNILKFIFRRSKLDKKCLISQIFVKFLNFYKKFSVRFNIY